MDFSQMVSEIFPNLGTTLAATEVGRLLQLFKASDIEIGQPTLFAGNTSKQSLVVELRPSDKRTFVNAFIENGEARITRHYTDGREVKHSIWKCSKFGVDSDPYQNIRSRSEFKSGKWEQDGIEKVVVEVLV